MAYKDVQEAHYKDLAQWVSLYKVYRSAGKVKDTIELRDRIKAAIDAHSLDATRVWGKDPDDPANRS